MIDMKKSTSILCAITTLLLLSSCVQHTQEVDPLPPEEQMAPVETPINRLESEIVLEHEELAPLNETAENAVYYQRVDDESGKWAYEVKRFRDGEIVRFPVDGIVLYLTQDTTNYYEKTELTYTYDNKTVTTEQYALYVTVNSDNADTEFIETPVSDET